jgi:hypothetical protein
MTSGRVEHDMPSSNSSSVIAIKLRDKNRLPSCIILFFTFYKKNLNESYIHFQGLLVYIFQDPRSRVGSVIRTSYVHASAVQLLLTAGNL